MVYQKLINIVFLLALMSYSVYYLLDTMRLRQWDERMVVVFLFVFFVLFAGINIIMIIIDIYKSKTGKESAAELVKALTFTQVLFDRRVLFLICTVVYLLVINILGFFVASFFYFLALSWLLGTKKIYTLIGVPIVMLGAAYGFFVLFLGIRLPTGIFL